MTGSAKPHSESTHLLRVWSANLHDASLQKILHGAGFMSALLYLYLGSLSTNQTHHLLWPFLAIMLVLALVSWGLYVALNARYVQPSETSGQSLAWLKAWRGILLWAVIFRLIGLSFEPILEDDYFRYLWDAFHFAVNGTPYGHAPSEYFGATHFGGAGQDNVAISPQFQTILDGINYPDTPTIYGPVLQYAFLLAYYLTPGEVFGLQLVFTFAEILLLLVLAKMSPRPALILFAWCPLLIKETAFTAHPDVLGVLLLMVSLLALQRSRLALAAILLGLSLGAKIFAILLAPIILLRCRPIHWLLCLLTLALVYAPFVLINSADIYGLFAFAKDWQFNGSAHALLVYLHSHIGGHEAWPKLAVAVAFCSFYAWYMWHYFVVESGFKFPPESHPRSLVLKNISRLKALFRHCQSKALALPRGDWIFGVFFLLAPAVNAWYLVWLLAFAATYPTRWAWAASFMLLLSYVVGGNLDESTAQLLGLDPETMGLYQQPFIARVLEYGIIFLALFFDYRARMRGAAYTRGGAVFHKG